MEIRNKYFFLFLLAASALFSYTEEKPVIAWTFIAGGPVYSSPAYYKGSIYIGSDDSSLYCLDVLSGRKNWEFKTGGIIRCKPALRNNSVFFASDDGFLYSLKANSGEKNWSFNIGNKIKRVLPGLSDSSGNYWDYMQSSPCIEGGIVFVGSGDSCLYAVFADSGKLKWKTKTGGFVRSSPQVYRKNVYVGSFDGYIYSFNKLDGSLIWKFDTRGSLYKHVQPSPSINNGILYCGSRNPMFYALNAYNGKEIWKYSFGTSWVESSALIEHGTVYVGSSDLNSVLAFDAGTGELKWETKINGTAWSSPCYSNGDLFIGMAGYTINKNTKVGGALLIFDVANGKLKQQVNCGKTDFIGGVVSSPVIQNGIVYYGSLDGKVYAVKE